MRQHEDHHMLKSVLVGVLIALFGASVGFGVSQTAITSEVNRHGVEITHLANFDRDIIKRLDTVEEKNFASHSELLNMIRDIMKQNQEFISIIKVQNELLMRNKPAI